MTSDTTNPPTLRRAITLPLLTLYGLGVTVGAGIYVLIGATVADAGGYAWVAFLLAAFVVGFTAFSYAELTTRYPVSAGEAAYVEAGFGTPRFAMIVGLFVALSGMVSASAIAVGAAGYLGALTGTAAFPTTIGIVIAMGLLAWWGISESVTAAAIVTVIEILGLLFVILWGLAVADQGGVTIDALIPPLKGDHWAGIVAASLLAFFAFIGFEDMVNVAEEVENPRRNMPLAIVITLVIATILYVATCIAVLIAVPIDSLAGAEAPLSLVFAGGPDVVKASFAAVAVVATMNGVLIQMIMSSRVLYGMADRGRLPAMFKQVSRRTQTPGVATACVTLIILGLSLFLPIDELAAWTSQIVLGVFVCVNLALIALKWRGQAGGDAFIVPMIVPILGVLTSVGLFVATAF